MVQAPPPAPQAHHQMEALFGPLYDQLEQQHAAPP